MTGKVVWHVAMSLDGFIAGPNHEMDWGAGSISPPGMVEDSVADLGAILAGRRGYDAGVAAGIDPTTSAYGGVWQGPIFVLTHHPEDARPYPGLTFLNCDIAEAIETGLAAADGKNLELFGADIARQAVLRGLVDELRVHIAPVMLGDGVRLFESHGTEPVRWARIHDGDPALVASHVYHPLR